MQDTISVISAAIYKVMESHSKHYFIVTLDFLHFLNSFSFPMTHLIFTNMSDNCKLDRNWSKAMFLEVDSGRENGRYVVLK